MNFRYILLNGVVTRDVPLDLYIILPISIILGVAFYSIINSLKLNDMLNKLGFSNKKQYEAFKSSCPLNYKNKFVLSDEWAINEYSHTVYHTDDIINASPVALYHSFIFLTILYLRIISQKRDLSSSLYALLREHT